ncbi:MAG: alpha/beta hydrolase [Ardenticatenales bacterium]
MDPPSLHFTREGDGPVILFLHGFPTDGRLWGPLVEGLRARHTCIVVDLPGCGASPALPGGGLDPDGIVHRLEALRAGLGVGAWRIVGHDAGAVVAAHYAARHPARVEGLVLMAAPLFPDFEPPAIVRAIRRRWLGDAIAPLVVRGLQAFLATTLTRDDPRNRRIVRGFAAHYSGLAGARRFVRLARWGDPAVVLGRTAAILPTITAPTLIVHGARDAAIGLSFAERAAAAIPGARLHVEDCGHFCPLDAAGPLAVRMAAFLAGAPDRATAALIHRTVVTRRYRATTVSAATRARTAAASASGLSPHQRSAVS